MQRLEGPRRVVRFGRRLHHPGQRDLEGDHQRRAGRAPVSLDVWPRESDGVGDGGEALEGR